MNCQTVKEHLNQYLDGELQDPQVSNMKKHLESCPLCNLEAENEHKLNSMMKHYLAREEAPYELRESIIGKINQPSLWQRVVNGILVPKNSLAIGITAFAVFIAVISVSVLQRPFPIYAESVHNHTDFLKGGYPLEIKTNDMDEALAWFEGKMDFAIQPPHVDLTQAKLVGARIVHIKDKKTAYFIFEKDGHKISAFYVDLKGKRLPKIPKENIMDKQGVTIFAKNDKGFNSILCFHKSIKTGCIIVSDMSQEALLRIMA